MDEKNIILFDWFAFSSPAHSPLSVIQFLGLEELHFFETYGNRHYASRLLCGSISIFYNGKVNEGVYVDMSGDGCREFEEYGTKSFIDVFRDIVDEPDLYHITRLDVAFDCFDKTVLNIDKLKKETEALNFVSKFSDPVIEYGVRSKSLTIYYGSRSSEVYMRCYNKAKERQREDVDYWVRWELVLKNDRAYSFISQYMNGEDIGTLFYGVINNYIRFIVPDKNQTNISRLKVAKWWLNFVQTVEKIRVYTPKKTAYNLLRCEGFAYRQAGNAVSALIDIKGVTGFVSELNKNRPVRSIKYQSLIDMNGTSDDGILNFLKEHDLKNAIEREDNYC